MLQLGLGDMYGVVSRALVRIWRVVEMCSGAFVAEACVIIQSIFIALVLQYLQTIAY